MGLRSLCSWTSWTHSSSQAQWQAWGELAVTASARTVRSTSPRASSALPCCQPPAWVYPRPALPACPYHQSPDIPAGGWDTGQSKKEEENQGDQASRRRALCTSSSWTTPLSLPPFSPSFPLSLLTPFSPPSFFSSSPPHPSIPCLPGSVILMI